MTLCGSSGARFLRFSVRSLAGWGLGVGGSLGCCTEAAVSLSAPPSGCGRPSLPVTPASGFSPLPGAAAGCPSPPARGLLYPGRPLHGAGGAARLPGPRERLRLQRLAAPAGRGCPAGHGASPRPGHLWEGSRQRHLVEGGSPEGTPRGGVGLPVSRAATGHWREPLSSCQGRAVRPGAAAPGGSALGQPPGALAGCAGPSSPGRAQLNGPGGYGEAFGLAVTLLPEHRGGPIDPGTGCPGGISRS